MNSVHICKSPLGYFAFDDNGGLVFYEILGKDVNKNMHKMKGFSKEFMDNLKDYETREDERGYSFLRAQIRELAITIADFKDEEELHSFLCSFGTALSKSRLRGAIGRDKILIQAFSAIEDLMNIENLLNERIYEWYSLHYPEVDKKNIVENVKKYGRRENFPDFKESLGAILDENDETAVKGFAETLYKIGKEKESLKKYLKESARGVIPNFSALVDEMLALRMLSHAGSLEKISRMPASAIQLMGAEKALFRHLKTKHKKNKFKSPKYGYIFNSYYVQKASEEKKGRVARILASKLMQACRIDYYSDRDESQRLKKELEKELNKL
ncbi:hypothetical protein ACFLQN_02980 [Candidatus Aenigmatarchaeota archaeon]